MDEDQKIREAKVRTFDYEYYWSMLCPECGKYMLVSGYVCYGCGYDKSIAQEKINKELTER